jgi:hypothetical protein
MSKLGIYYSSIGRLNVIRSWKMSWLPVLLVF